jgi:thioesterase domain-containing protein
LSLLLNGCASRGEPVTESRDAVELQLCDIWRSVLEVPVVRPDDDFFRLGGDSLLGSRILVQINLLFEVALRLADLLATPTVAGLAAAVRAGRGSTPAGPLVRIQAGDGQAPLYVFHPLPGTVLGYTALARALGPAQTVWGLQAAGLEPGTSPRRSIPEMVDEYVEAMRAVHDGGPWHLAGYSMGGLFAFEAARQLTATGDPVGLVALFDTPPPAPAEPEDEHLIRTLALRNVAKNVLRLDIDLDWLCGLAADDQVRVVLERGIETGTLPFDYDTERVRRLFEIRVHNSLAAASYDPDPHPGPVVLFLARDRPPPAPGPDAPVATWDRLAGDITPHVVPGTHPRMLEPENVTVAARLVNEHLRPLGQRSTAPDPCLGDRRSAEAVG